MHSFVISKDVKWCHLIWPTLYVKQPWPFSVTWCHRTRDIRFDTCHFLLVVLWNRASIYVGFWRYWALSILQYPKLVENRSEGGPDLRKWRRAPDGCVTPLRISSSKVYRFMSN